MSTYVISNRVLALALILYALLAVLLVAATGASEPLAAPAGGCPPSC